ncbi:serine incorporator/TMS membrane protein [Cladochytrium replicatum]|nr:serine incorporator/TMS membrane protein [Cladochytrium replicatum]
MGVLLLSLITDAACCFGKAACNCMCRACGTSSTATRVGYASLLLLSATLSSLMLNEQLVKYLEAITFAYVKLSCGEGMQCFGVLGVIRICFATTLFHVILSAAMYGVQTSRDWRSGLQNGFWAWKIIAWVGLVVLSFVIPNPFFLGWRQYFDLPGAAVFLLIQIILLIDFAYALSDTLLEQWEMNDDWGYLAALIVVTFGSLIATVVVIGFLYGYFGGPSCPLNNFFITFNLILCIGAVLLSIAPFVQEENPKSGLAQGAMMTIYSTYLVASAVLNKPTAEDDICNPMGSGGERTTVIVGAILTFLAIAYSTSRVATQNVLGSSEGASGGSDMSMRNRGSYTAVGGDDEIEDDEKDGVQYNYSFFHLIFALAAMYLAMLLTNWNTITVKDGFASVGKSMAAVWVKIVSSWVVLLLYG